MSVCNHDIFGKSLWIQSETVGSNKKKIKLTVFESGIFLNNFKDSNYKDIFIIWKETVHLTKRLRHIILTQEDLETTRKITFKTFHD